MDNGIARMNTPESDALARDWADYVGVKYCLVTNSGTASLHMSVSALGIGPGDEVIVPAYTFVASATSVMHNMAIPVFVDIESEYWNIDVAKIEKAITPYTKAIMPVHLNGNPADLDEIRAIAKKHNLVVIEDACQAHGAKYKGKKVGTFGEASAFSLNASKNLAAGDGGLFVTDDEETFERACMVREFGEKIYKGQKRKYNSYAMGWMYRPVEFVGAFARSQLKRLDEMNARRRENAGYLREALKQFGFVRMPEYKKDRECVYWFFPFRISPKEIGIDQPDDLFRDKVCKAFEAEGIHVYAWQTHPVPGQKLFQDKIGYGKGIPWTDIHYKGNVSYNVKDYPVACQVAFQSMWLTNGFQWPSTIEDMKHIVRTFEKVLSQLNEVAKLELSERQFGAARYH